MTTYSCLEIEKQNAHCSPCSKAVLFLQVLEFLCSQAKMDWLLFATKHRHTDHFAQTMRFLIKAMHRSKETACTSIRRFAGYSRPTNRELEFLHVCNKYVVSVIVSNVRNFLLNLRNPISWRESCTPTHLTRPLVKRHLKTRHSHSIWFRRGKFRGF